MRDIRKNDVIKIRVVGIYGWPDGGSQHQSWELIEELTHENDMFILTVKDFMELLLLDDKMGGNNEECTLIKAFHLVMDNHCLNDLDVINLGSLRSR